MIYYFWEPKSSFRLTHLNNSTRFANVVKKIFGLFELINFTWNAIQMSNRIRKHYRNFGEYVPFSSRIFSLKWYDPESHHKICHEKIKCNKREKLYLFNNRVSSKIIYFLLRTPKIFKETLFASIYQVSAIVKLNLNRQLQYVSK